MANSKYFDSQVRHLLGIVNRVRIAKNTLTYLVRDFERPYGGPQKALQDITFGEIFGRLNDLVETSQNMLTSIALMNNGKISREVYTDLFHREKVKFINTVFSNFVDSNYDYYSSKPDNEEIIKTLCSYIDCNYEENFPFIKQYIEEKSDSPFDIILEMLGVLKNNHTIDEIDINKEIAFANGLIIHEKDIKAFFEPGKMKLYMKIEFEIIGRPGYFTEALEIDVNKENYEYIEERFKLYGIDPLIIIVSLQQALIEEV